MSGTNEPPRFITSARMAARQELSGRTFIVWHLWKRVQPRMSQMKTNITNNNSALILFVLFVCIRVIRGLFRTHHLNDSVGDHLGQPFDLVFHGAVRAVEELEPSARLDLRPATTAGTDGSGWGWPACEGEPAMPLPRPCPSASAVCCGMAGLEKPSKEIVAAGQRGQFAAVQPRVVDAQSLLDLQQLADLWPRSCRTSPPAWTAAGSCSTCPASPGGNRRAPGSLSHATAPWLASRIVLALFRRCGRIVWAKSLLPGVSYCRQGMCPIRSPPPAECRRHGHAGHRERRRMGRMGVHTALISGSSWKISRCSRISLVAATRRRSACPCRPPRRSSGLKKPLDTPVGVHRYRPPPNGR